MSRKADILLYVSIPVMWADGIIGLNAKELQVSIGLGVAWKSSDLPALMLSTWKP